MFIQRWKARTKVVLEFFEEASNGLCEKAESVNKARAIVTEESIRSWFRVLKQYLTDTKNEDILEDPDRILNGDETRCPKTVKVLGPRGWKNL